MTTLREAAQALLTALDEQGGKQGEPVHAALKQLDEALVAPPPDVPEVRRVIARLLERHEQMLATMAQRDRHIQRQELERLTEELVFAMGAVMTSLREAARALVAEIEPWRGKLSGQLDARAEELREAADAPPPGLVGR